MRAFREKTTWRRLGKRIECGLVKRMGEGKDVYGRKVSRIYSLNMLQQT